METGILLILLIMGDGGQVESSFAEHSDMETCVGMSAGINEVFKQTGVKVVKLDCYKTGQKFTKFSHNVPKDTPRYHYMVDYRTEVPKVTRYNSQQDCKQHISGTDQQKVFCTTSPQSLLK